MDTSEGSRVGDLLADIKKQQLERSVSANLFPKTYEEYMALPLEERLSLAKEMMAHYADITKAELDGPKSVVVTIEIETEDLSVNLEAKVGFVNVSPGSEMPGEPEQHTPARLQVGVKAISAGGDLTSPFDHLGSIEFEEDPGVPIMARPRPRPQRSNVRLITLSEPEAIDMVEIIDAAVKKLIEDTIAGDRRSIGGAAVAGARES
jgi:hypothetical protein